MAVIGFASTKPFEVTPEVALPVDLVSVEEYTNLTTGLKSGEIKETPQAPKAPEENNAAPQPEPQPEEKPAPAQPAAAPEPEPEPEPAQAEAEPAPPPEPEPEPEAKPKEPEKPQYVQLPKKVEMPRRPPRPRQEVARNEPKPTPITPQAREEQKQFDPDSIAALLDKQERPPESGGVTQEALDGQASLGAPTGLANRLSMSDIDYLRQQMSRCWSPPVGVLDAVGLVVKLDLELNLDGSLARDPIVANSSGAPIFTIAAEAARRAVIQCQPYSLPPEKFDVWRRMIVNFDPREMMGG
ncbi:MAG: cell envelope biogenesis protein TolA [Tepidamorphaceae bacterium]|nr:cell envelope biogenesis protein TolA [Rhodobiaceae bacterium]MCC0048305.1 cell envelope biogenesis protein TolA [Rhodobiaceae bacterium]